MTEEEMIERGREIFQQCYSGVVPLPESTPPNTFGGLNMKMFADLWGDERLSFRDKRLIVLGVIAGRAGDPSLCTIHARSALRNGELTAEELRSALMLALYYAGAPAVAPLFVAVERLLAETDGGKNA